ENQEKAIKSQKQSNETSTSNVTTYDIDPKEFQECIDWEKEIQNHTKKRSFSTLDCDSQESKECINLDSNSDVVQVGINSDKSERKDARLTIPS
ncbi:1125_t:CDS:2, partial [Diversispora eburnea]